MEPTLRGEEARVAAAIEGWADGIRARDARAVCRLTDYGSRAAQPSARDCVAEIRASQEFTSSPRFDVVEVRVRGPLAEALVRVTEKSGDAPPDEVELGAIRREGRWRLLVPPE